MTGQMTVDYSTGFRLSLHAVTKEVESSVVLYLKLYGQREGNSVGRIRRKGRRRLDFDRMQA